MSNELVPVKKTKVVINTCYGGFGLSEKAVKAGRMLANNATWGGFTLKGEKFPETNDVWEGAMSDDPAGGHDLARHDPILVRVVEQLKDKAAGRFSVLEIEEIEGNQYRVEEYDGREWVETPDKIDWVTV